MNKVKRRRLELEFTQYDVEKLTGIKQSKLSLIEGGYREPSPEEKKKIAKVLRSEIQGLFEE
jgi:transcriptional regulator with XRE-family HTH domain